MSNKIFSLLLIFITLFAIQGISYAEKPSELTLKESFLVAWEKHQKSLPTTVTLEKTKEDGTYNYETSLFPYKGPLKILNVIIDKDLSYYYDYDLGLDNVVKGVVEIELSDLPNKEFSQKHYYSHGIWLKNNFLFFNEDSKSWLNAKQWRELENNSENTGITEGKTCFMASYKNITNEFMPLIIIAIILVPFIIISLISRKKHISKFDTSMERQLEAVELSKEGYAIQKQSLELQKEQSDILKKLYENTKKQ